jgi:acyl carrier protein
MKVQMNVQTDLEREVAQLFVQTLKLETAAGDIDPCTPLFGDGLGLDSIDMLEIALAISKEYGVELRSEDRKILASLRALATHIAEHRIHKTG